MCFKSGLEDEEDSDFHKVEQWDCAAVEKLRHLWSLDLCEPGWPGILHQKYQVNKANDSVMQLLEITYLTRRMLRIWPVYYIC